MLNLGPPAIRTAWSRDSGFAADLYVAFPVKRLFLGFPHSSLFGAGKAVLRPVACDQVPGARGRGQGTETLAELGAVPPSVACVWQRLERLSLRRDDEQRDGLLVSKLRGLRHDHPR